MNTLLEDFKTVVNKQVEKAREETTTLGGFIPTLMAASEEELISKPIDFDDISKLELSIVLNEFKYNDDVQAIALIFSAYTLVRDNDDTRPIAGKVSDEPDNVEAVMAYIYTRTGSSFRRLPFKYPEPGQDPSSIWWGDEGWVEIPPAQMLGWMANPFFATTQTE